MLLQQHGSVVPKTLWCLSAHLDVLVGVGCGRFLEERLDLVRLRHVGLDGHRNTAFSLDGFHHLNARNVRLRMVRCASRVLFLL